MDIEQPSILPSCNHARHPCKPFFSIASWGLFQFMGFNHATCGEPSVALEVHDGDIMTTVTVMDDEGGRRGQERSEIPPSSKI